MSLDFYVLIIPFCSVPVILVSLDYLNKSAELEKKKNNVVDFDNFVQLKEQGDAVDSDIAQLLDFEKIAA